MPANINDKCSDASYQKPSKFKLIIQDRADGSELESIDMFQTQHWNEGLNLFEVSCNDGLDITNEFSYSFDDRDHIIDTTKIGKGNIVIMQTAKESSADFVNIFYGFCRNMEPIRTDTNMLKWRMTGFGSQIGYNEVMCSFIRSAERLGLADPRPDISDTSMRASNLYIDFITNPDVPIYGDKSLAEIFGYTVDGVDPLVKDVITSLNIKNQYGATIHKAIVDAVGAIAGIDASNDAFLRWPTKVHSGITVKATRNPLDKNTDYGAYTSYIIGQYSAPQSIVLPDFANIITGRATISREFLSSQEGATGSKSTSGQALGQMFKPTSLGFKDIALYLQKVGNPTSSENKLNGSIILDNGFTPRGGKKIATWYIKLDRIKDAPTVVSPTEIKILTKTIDATQNHWLIVYERAGTHSGHVDDENTILWMNNADTTTPNQYSAIALGGDKDSPALPWQIYPNGPTFAFSLYQVKRRQSFAVDPLSVKLHGPIMVPVDSSFIDDTFTLNKYLHVELQQRVRPKIPFSQLPVSIPNNHTFKAGEMVTFLDPDNPMFTLTKYNNPLISQVSWSWNAATEPQGTRTVRLLLSGRYDWLSDFFEEL